MVKRLFSSGLMLAMLLLCSMAHAFKMAPIKVDFYPAGQGATQIFKLENDSDAPIAVQVSMLTRAMDIDGKEKYKNADEDFIVYPPQAVIGPHKTQTVRVKWAGDLNPAQEQSYRIVAEQLPVNLQKTAKRGVSVNLLVRYLGAIYIVPRDAEPHIVVEEITRTKRNDGTDGMIVTVHNKGNTHAILGDLSLRLTCAGYSEDSSTTIVLPPEQLVGMNGENILAGHKRRFVLPWPSQLDSMPMQAELDYTPWR